MPLSIQHIRIFSLYKAWGCYIKDTYFNNEYKFFLETFESIEICLDPNRNGFIKRILD